MHHPYIAEILLSSCCSDVEPALCKKVLAPEVALLSGYGTLLSLMVLWSHKKSQEGFPVQWEFPFFTPALWLWFFNRTCTCRSLQIWRLSLTLVIPFWGEEHDHGWLPGFDASRSSYIHTHCVTAASLMLLVLFLIYSIIEQDQNQCFVLLSAQHALCALCSSAEFWLRSGMILFGIVSNPCPGT